MSDYGVKYFYIPSAEAPSETPKLNIHVTPRADNSPNHVIHRMTIGNAPDYIDIKLCAGPEFTSWYIDLLKIL